MEIPSDEKIEIQAVYVDKLLSAVEFMCQNKNIGTKVYIVSIMRSVLERLKNEVKKEDFMKYMSDLYDMYFKEIRE